MSREQALTRAKWSLAGVIVGFGALVVAVVATGASVSALGLDATATRTAVIGLFLAAVGATYVAHAEILAVWLSARMEGVADLDAVAVSDDEVSQRRRGALLMVAGGLVVVVVGLL
ncbi:hypothetical protein [Haloarchaeobius salinus]|uniref:hypothetical protein n=1 Tax=Haloarchaeobius salinus TaxID=1198298 RepID=UPI00210AA359|nr:hypothetical protein [Haloarchaeobius salinus]